MENTFAGKVSTAGRTQAAARPLLRGTSDRNALAEANAGLVFAVLNRHFRALKGDDREDAESAGYLGLLRAADRWTPHLGSFGSYTYKMILGYVRNHLRGVRTRGFAGVVNSPVPISEVASIDAPLPGLSSESVRTIADTIADPAADFEGAMMEAIERADRYATIWQQIDRILAPRYADLLRLRYREGLSFQQIADRRGESLHSVEVGHYRATARLRQCVERGMIGEGDSGAAGLRLDDAAAPTGSTVPQPRRQTAPRKAREARRETPATARERQIKNLKI